MAVKCDFFLNKKKHRVGTVNGTLELIASYNFQRVPLCSLRIVAVQLCRYSATNFSREIDRRRAIIFRLLSPTFRYNLLSSNATALRVQHNAPLLLFVRAINGTTDPLTNEKSLSAFRLHNIVIVGAGRSDK